MKKPTPIVFPRISRTIEEIRADIYVKIDSVQEEFASRGWLPRRLNLNKGVIRGIIEILAWCIWQVYSLMEKLLKQAVPHHSVDDWLDLHLESVGLTRKTATKARGYVRFIRKVNSTGNIVIQPGRIVRTLPDGKGDVYRYVTTELAVLLAGEDFIDVLVESEEYGAGANAGPGQICEIVTPIIGIENVTNTSHWLVSEGADKESNASAHDRIRLRWMANNGCTKHAYKLWALSVPGVISVEILDKHPRGQGSVGIVVRGSAGLPTEALLERVKDAIRPLAPINDEWYVISPTPVPLKISGCLHYVTGDPEVLKRQAELRILSLFSDHSIYEEVTPLGIGQDVPRDILIAAVMSVIGVKSIDWFMPNADVIVPRDGIAILESVEFTTLSEDEA